MLQKTTLLIILSVFVLASYGQNDPNGTFAIFNQMFYNPGYAGDGNEIEARLVGSNQWMGFGNGAPITQFFNVDAPFNLFGLRHGVGLSILNDEIGFERNVGVNLSYAYRRSLTQGDLGIGIGLNVINSSYDMDKAISTDGETNDWAIPASNESPLAVDLNLGLYYKADNLFLSVSGRNLTNAKKKFKGENKIGTHIGRQVYFSSGYEYQLPNPMFSIEPIAFVGTDFATTQLSLTNIVRYNKRFFGGAGLKFANSISEATVLFGLDLPSGIHAAIAYDINTTRLTHSTVGSFEFMVGYSFNLEIDKDNRKYKSVRFL